jgi:Flp pilus assembly protein TadG
MNNDDRTKCNEENPHFRPSVRGQATVEFALVMIVLLAMLYGIMEVGRLFFINAEVENAAREGAHYAALHPEVTTNYLRQNIISPKLTLIDANDLNISKCFLITPGCPAAGVGPFYPVQITVTYSWTSLVNFVTDMSTLILKPIGRVLITAESTRII